MTISEEDINAYVDGELSTEDAARVASAVASDPNLARQVAQLTELKAKLPDIVPPMPEIVLPDQEARLAARMSWSPFRMGAAVALLAMLFLSGAGVYLYKGEPDRTLAGLAIAVHEDWAKIEPTVAPGAVPVASADLGSLTNLSLTSAGLTLTTTQKMTWYGHQTLRLGFVGTRGCKVSLFAIDTQDDVLIPRDVSRNLRTAHWRSERGTYLLLGSGMDWARFAVLSDALRQFSQQLTPFGPEVEQRLAASRAEALPCHA